MSTIQRTRLSHHSAKNYSSRRKGISRSKRKEVAREHRSHGCHPMHSSHSRLRARGEGEEEGILAPLHHREGGSSGRLLACMCVHNKEGGERYSNTGILTLTILGMKCGNRRNLLGKYKLRSISNEKFHNTRSVLSEPPFCLRRTVTEEQKGVGFFGTQRRRRNVLHPPQ